MKNPSDRERLLADLLSDGTPDGFRVASLEHALAQARRARYQRQFSVALAIFAVSLAFLFRSHRPTPASPSLVVTTQTPPAAPKIRIINDDELLNLFPDRAVALVGPPDHRQLVFLDAGH